MAHFNVNIFVLVILVGFSTIPHVLVSSEEDTTYATSLTESSSTLETTTLNNKIDEVEETISKEQLLENKVRNLTEQVEKLESINSRLAEETKELRGKLRSEPETEQTSTSTPVQESTSSSPVEIVKVFSCEYSDLSISCARGLIHIHRAVYGRNSKEICSKESASIKTDFPEKLLQSSCPGKETDLPTVQTKCESQAACNVSAANAVFGDPCSWTFKYLEVEYSCS